MALTMQTVDMHSTRKIARFLQVLWNIYVRPDGVRTTPVGAPLPARSAQPAPS